MFKGFADIRERESIDLIITDPPYLMEYSSGWRDKNHKFSKQILNDNISQGLGVIGESLRLMNLLLKEGGAVYIFCSEHHIDLFKQVIEKYFTIKNILIWVKQGGMGDLKGSYIPCTEFIIFAVKGTHILNGNRDKNVIRMNRVNPLKAVHQNQKPLELINYFILKSSKRGDTVLDCFMGGGTTGVACLQTGRNFIGIELDKEYFKIAEQRIKDEKEQTRLM